MSLIPFAPAAAPAPAPAAPSAPARASGELGAVFSALVDALTEEFLPTDESSSAEQLPATDEALLGTDATEVDPTATDAAAVVALLLGATAPPEPTAPAPVDGSVDGEALVATPPADQLTPDATTPDATIPDPTDVVPDTDVDPAVGGEADGPVDAAATLEAAVEAGPVPPPADEADDSAAPIGFDTVEPGTPELAPTDEAADVPAEVLRTTDQGDAVELAPVTTDQDPAGEADGDAAGADRTTLDGTTAEGPEARGLETAPVRPTAPNPGAETTATAPVVGSSASAPSAPAHSVNSATTPAEPTPPALPDQLVTVLEPLRRAPDGTHRVSMQLRPDELGEVQIDVQVRGNEISLSVRADVPGTVDLLRASVAELRAQLEAAGFQAGDLDVTGHSAEGATEQRSAGDADRSATDRTAGGSTGTDEATDAPPAPLSAAGLDLRL